MLKKTFRAMIMHTVIGDMIRDYQRLKPYFEWLESGKPVPPPHIVKQMTVKEYANKYKLKVFIESGTFHGDMLSAVKSLFTEIYSIELDQGFYGSAKAKFAADRHISIINGDSAVVLGEVLNHIEKPCLFWLDGHYSGGITAKGKTETPILGELSHIFNHPVRGHVILIDDARCFTGKNSWPYLEELRIFLFARKPNWDFVVKDDVIRIHEKEI